MSVPKHPDQLARMIRYAFDSVSAMQQLLIEVNRSALAGLNDRNPAEVYSTELVLALMRRWEPHDEVWARLAWRVMRVLSIGAHARLGAALGGIFETLIPHPRVRTITSEDHWLRLVHLRAGLGGTDDVQASAFVGATARGVPLTLVVTGPRIEAAILVAGCTARSWRPAQELAQGVGLLLVLETGLDAACQAQTSAVLDAWQLALPPCARPGVRLATVGHGDLRARPALEDARAQGVRVMQLQEPDGVARFIASDEPEPIEYLHGRQSVLDALEQSAAAILLTGLGGCGKSAIARYKVRRLLATGQCLRAVHVKLSQSAHREPGAAALELLRQALTDPVAGHRLRELVQLELTGASEATRGALIGALYRLDLDDGFTHDPDDRHSTRNAILLGLERLAALLAQCPYVILVDDLHWVDSLSEHLFRNLIAAVAHGGAARFVATARCEGWEHVITGLHVISVPELDEQAWGELLRDLHIRPADARELPRVPALAHKLNAVTAYRSDPSHRLLRDLYPEYSEVWVLMVAALVDQPFSADYLLNSLWLGAASNLDPDAAKLAEQLVSICGQFHRYCYSQIEAAERVLRRFVQCGILEQVDEVPGQRSYRLNHDTYKDDLLAGLVTLPEYERRQLVGLATLWLLRGAARRSQRRAARGPTQVACLLEQRDPSSPIRWRATALAWELATSRLDVEERLFDASRVTSTVAGSGEGGLHLQDLRPEEMEAMARVCRLSVQWAARVFPRRAGDLERAVADGDRVVAMLGEFARTLGAPWDRLWLNASLHWRHVQIYIANRQDRTEIALALANQLIADCERVPNLDPRLRSAIHNERALILSKLGWLAAWPNHGAQPASSRVYALDEVELALDIALSIGLKRSDAKLSALRNQRGWILWRVGLRHEAERAQLKALRRASYVGDVRRRAWAYIGQGHTYLDGLGVRTALRLRSCIGHIDYLSVRVPDEERLIAYNTRYLRACYVLRYGASATALIEAADGFESAYGLTVEVSRFEGLYALYRFHETRLEAHFQGVGWPAARWQMPSLEEAASLAEVELGARREAGILFRLLAREARYRGDFDRASALAARARVTLRECGDRYEWCLATLELARATCEVGAVWAVEHNRLGRMSGLDCDLRVVERFLNCNDWRRAHDDLEYQWAPLLYDAEDLDAMRDYAEMNDLGGLRRIHLDRRATRLAMGAERDMIAEPGSVGARAPDAGGEVAAEHMLGAHRHSTIERLTGRPSRRGPV